uniref:Ig-like domain-containing protein n=1 Tax=Vombatus ursinus TaxID=29139 RepID=A0A4X2KAH4_VOMUR
SILCTYTGVVGQTVLLPCSYVVNPRNKTVPICWGKGACPLSRCTEEFLTTDGWKVTHQKIKRYKLKGDLFRGNVSLTIENVGEADSGIYCCRIEFKGLLNDQKTSLKLVVKPAETTTFRLQPQQTSRNTQSNNPIVRALSCYFYCFSQLKILFVFPQEITSTANELQKSGDATRIGIYIGVSIFMVLVLALALGTFILKRRSYSKKKLQKSSIIFMSNPLPKDIRNIAGERLQVEENIYTIEENIYEIQDEYEYSGRAS